MPTILNFTDQDHYTDTARAIAELGKLTRDQLLDRWRATICPTVPSRLSNSLMIEALAYDLQVRAYGGLSPQTVRALRRAANPRSGRPAPRPGTRPGTRLVREWNGALHEVDVLENGYLWRGQSYRSLSAIAKAITGTKWSGPRFFGTGQKP